MQSLVYGAADAGKLLYERGKLKKLIFLGVPIWGIWNDGDARAVLGTLEILKVIYFYKETPPPGALVGGKDESFLQDRNVLHVV